jgi:Uma2 family endonuclease
MAALPQLITVEEFRQLPEGELQHELHFGEVVAMARPTEGHSDLQHRLLMLLSPLLAEFGVVRVEYPYRPLPEFELRAADVAVVSHARRRETSPKNNLRGAPDLVIEVKSPSNTERQLRELAAFCLTRGSSEFWIMDMDRKSVTVFRHDGIPAVFTSGDKLLLSAFGGGDLSVDEIFA